MAVYRKVILALEHDRAGILQPGLGLELGDDRIRHRLDGALLGDRRAVNALYAARGQEERQIVQRTEAARTYRAFALRALLERVERGAVVRHQVGAQVAGGFLRAAGLDDQLALVLLEVADDRGCVRAHARVAGVREIRRIVQPALPVAVGLARVAGEEHAGVVFAAVQAGKPAFVDLIRVAGHGFCKGDGYIGQPVAVCRRGGEGDQPGRAVDRGYRHRLTVYRSGHGGFVQILGVHLKLGRRAVADEGVDALGRQQVDGFVARAAAGRLGGDGRSRHIGDVLHLDSLPGRVCCVAAHRTVGLPVQQVEHAVHHKGLGERRVHIRAQLGLIARRRTAVQLVPRVDGKPRTVRQGEQPVNGRGVAVLRLPARAFDQKVVLVADQVLHVGRAGQGYLGRVRAEVHAAKTADKGGVLGLGLRELIGAHQTISCTAVNCAGQWRSSRSAYSVAAQLNLALSSSATSSAASP